MRTIGYLKTVSTVLTVLFSVFFTASCDQTGTTTTFTGTVTDSETAQPLPGVAVAVMPFNLGQETDLQGKYSIALPRTTEDVYLVFSKPGYESWETLSMPLSPKKKNLYTIDAQLRSRIAKAVLSPQSVDFGAGDTSVVLTLSNPGGDTLRWGFLEMYFPHWLKVNPPSGELEMGASRSLVFTCDRSGLPIGEQKSEVQLVGGEVPLIVQVRLLVEGALLKAQGTSFDFGEEDSTAITILANQGNIPLNWALKDKLPGWLDWDPVQGTVPAEKEMQVSITANRSSLDFGNHSFSTTLQSNGGDTAYTFSITRTRDLIKVSPQSLDFGTESTTRTITLSRLSGVHPVPFTVVCEDENLQLSLAQGEISKENPTAQIVVTLDRDNIPFGTSESRIMVLAPDQEFTIRVNYATAAVPAEVTTDGYELDDSYRLRFKGTLVNNGGGSVVRHGHCWGTNSAPDPENGSFTDMGPIEEGRSFVSYPDELPPRGTTWYYRSYAINETGTSYGQTMTMQYAPPILDNPVLTFNAISEVLIFRVNEALGLPYADHGFIWNTSGDTPSMDKDQVVSLGEKTSGSNFFYNLSKPQRGVTYYVRSYAVNAFGRFLSGTSSLYLDIEEPKPETGDVDEISYYEALLKGNIVVLGSEKILAYGHCWSTDAVPTIDGSHTDLGTPSYAGEYSSRATKLLINTPYYYRAYVKTSKGVYYGQVLEFTTARDEPVVVQNGLKMYITTDQVPKAYDWTGRGPDLVVSNGITYNRNNKPAGTNAAISFNGSSGYLLSLDMNPVSGINKGTINFWLRFRQTMNKSLVYPLFGSVSEGGFYVEIRHNGTAWVLTLCLGPGKETHVIPLPSFAGIDISSMLGTSWHMMSIASNGTSMTVYLDGVNLYSQSMQMTFGVQKDFVVGANALNSTTINTFLPADMACLRFYDRVLSDPEISQIYNAGM
ncbi:MAG: carboxypeptidase-like regulatory domain-containing protein [Bacteroidales bacterium]|nr:carboxypeptidase-like regulatory domain-containing protein [Bacteroidales bacterium]